MLFHNQVVVTNKDIKMTVETNTVDTLDIDQNTDTNIDTDVKTDTDTDVDVVTDDNDISNEDTNTDDSDGKLTEEELDNLSDDEFIAYMDSGKLPIKAKSDNKDESGTNTHKLDKDQKETVIPTHTVDKKDDKESVDVDKPEIDYKSIHDQVFKPFKANGKEITPKTVEDVVSLMQMGSNYTKKMQLLSPMIKTVESLNNANIDEETLSFLIDVNNGNKEAISQLLQKNKIDPMDLSIDDSSYTPNKNNIASDKDVEFSETLLDINESIPKIEEILTTTWDNKSKTAILRDPMLMKALHEEIQMGRFDEVQKQVELEKTFGRYKGKSDVEIYIDVVTKLAHNQSKSIDTQKVQDTATIKNIPDKSKAAPTKSKIGKSEASLTVKDLLSMSDEDFKKLDAKKLV